ncbi:DUF2851 family protein [Rubrivirga sp.]|uniref:DUF2851 family protein n=1 Tax=Rubrivirga sp. TaxID=1885344 RepID=UPI003C761490
MSVVHEPLVAEPAESIARVPEAAIQDAWVRGLFDPTRLVTAEGEKVNVVTRGRLNRDSGPDVIGARIEVGGVLWAGDVEIHLASSAWETHGHHLDPAYDRVILHVVLSPDKRTGTLRRPDGSALPELVLLPHLDRSLRSLLRSFYLEPRSAPNCSHRWDEIDVDSWGREWIRFLGTERLRSRAKGLARDYTRRPDLDRLLIRRMFRALGYTANADTFEALADRLDLAALRRLDYDDVHATLLATSGLERPDLFDLEVEPSPMRAEAWKRGGRPANAPRRRLAQAAAWLSPAGVLRTDGIATLAESLSHSIEDALTALRPDLEDGNGHRLGATRATRVLTDAVLPVLMVDAELRDDHDLEDAVLRAYAALPAGDDHVMRRFGDAGLKPRTAVEAQGAHHLARSYCDEGRCARCAIGRTLYPALAGA